MARKTESITVGMRLQLGASVLAAARAVDTRSVGARLASFEGVHRRYGSAQRGVEEAAARLGAARGRLVEYDALLDDAVETLARALVGDGSPRRNPFGAFGIPAPGALKRLPVAEQAQAVHRLVAAVRRSKNASAKTLEAARAAAEAALTVEEAIASMATLQDGVRDARGTRDALARGWDSALAALKRGCRAAVDDGAPHLYRTLFPPLVRSNPKQQPREAPGAVPAPRWAEPQQAVEHEQPADGDPPQKRLRVATRLDGGGGRIDDVPAPMKPVQPPWPSLDPHARRVRLRRSRRQPLPRSDRLGRCRPATRRREHPLRAVCRIGRLRDRVRGHPRRETRRATACR